MPVPAIAAQATIATNMAGRATDIKLAKGVEETGGLMVMICERRRLPPRRPSADGPLRPPGRSGDVVEFLSYEDELLALLEFLASPALQNKWLGQRAAALAFVQAQRRAERAQTRGRGSSLSATTARLHKMPKRLQEGLIEQAPVDWNSAGRRVLEREELVRATPFPSGRRASRRQCSPTAPPPADRRQQRQQVGQARRRARSPRSRSGAATASTPARSSPASKPRSSRPCTTRRN